MEENQNISEEIQKDSENTAETAINSTETQTISESNSKETKLVPENPVRISILPGGEISPFSIKCKKSNQEYIKNLVGTPGIKTLAEALDHIIFLSQRPPQTIENPINEELKNNADTLQGQLSAASEKIIALSAEVEQLKNSQLNLSPGQSIVSLDPKVLELARKCRKYLIEKGFISATDNESYKAALINEGIKYFIKHKAGEFLNPQWKF